MPEPDPSLTQERNPSSVAPSGGHPRRLAILSFYFPPAGAAGSLRVSSFVRYLADLDWIPTVITTGELDVVFDDRTLLDDLPAKVRILRWFTSIAGTWAVRRKTSAGVAGTPSAATSSRPPWMRRARGFARRFVDTKLAVPDHAVAWSIASGLRLGFLLWRTRTRVLMTSSPPYSLILAGWIAKVISRSAWIADLRDPWGSGDRVHRRSFRDRVGFGLESFVVRRADYVLANTPESREYFIRLAPRRSDRIVVLPNGYDEDEVREAKRAAATEPVEQTFRIVHAGALYRGLREPSDVLEAIARIRGVAGRREIRLELPGDSAFHHDAAFLARIEALGLSQCIEFPGYVSHAAVLRRMARADVLLLIQGAGFPMQVPSKTYEYLAMSRPILAITPGGATSELVQRSPLGMVASPGDIDGIANCLQRVLRGEFAGKESLAGPATSREQLARRLVPVLEAALRDAGAYTSPHRSRSGRPTSP